MDHHPTAQTNWDAQSPLVVRLRELGALVFFQSIPNIQHAFHPGERWLCCIDEGCPGGVNLAGSGILLGVEGAARIAHDAGVTAITSHEECGAAKLWAKQSGKNAETSDDYGKEFSAELAKKLGVSYCHLPLSEMTRPAGLHVARVIYYDGTGTFDPARLPELPPGFVISRRYLDTEYALRECGIAISIALGDHGFGARFTPKEPLLIVAIGHPTDPALSLEKLRAELEPVAAAEGPRVAVDGLVAKW
ncbi:MAG: hypothetical protein Q7S23_03770 [bacterium]|nr:hypothetical protein [bacterium]